MSGELPAWAVFLYVLGSFGPVAVPALAAAVVLLGVRCWHKIKVHQAAARRAHSAQPLNVEDPP